ncbi:MAG: hypothetical protein ACI4I3_09515 [Acutalibacteraceae bacterium]
MTKTNFDTNIYQRSPHTVLGFHGCDRSVAEEVLNSQNKHLKASKNTYDWLGHGIYFWLNDPKRAYEWACQTQKRKPTQIKEPYVIGAVIDLGMCLNFCERQSVLLLQKAYEDLKAAFDKMGISLNEEFKNKDPDIGGFNLIRPLDCAVINRVHELVGEKDIFYDTVYGYFQEGTDAYDGAGIKEKSHIQICVRNTDCIKGYFLPRTK